MLRTFIASGAVIILITLSVTIAAQSAVEGTVYDQNDAVIPGFTIRASNRMGIVETKSDNNGRYYLTLSPGIYALSARWPEEGYWFTFRRSNLLIKDAEAYEIDLWPSRRSLTTSLVVTKRGSFEPTTLSPNPQYKEYSFSTEKKIRLILQFSKTNRRQSKFQNVILTYDRYTIHAEVAETSRSTSELILKGSVRFFGSGKIIWSDNATIFLERKSPTFRINGTSRSLAP